jgi:hypothetical protein
MSEKRVVKAFKARRMKEGAGFIVRRPIGTRRAAVSALLWLRLAFSHAALPHTR